MRIGIDLGGTKIEAIALDEQDYGLAQARIPTPTGDYPATLNALTALVHQIEHRTGQKGSVGIGTPGSANPVSGLIRNANSTCLNGTPLQQDLEKNLKRPIRLANDADCFALSEAIDGAATGFSSVFGVIIGTGAGAGIVINGELIPSINRIAGEWGHNPLPWPTPHELPGDPCYCGKNGCIETFLSGPGLCREYLRESGQQITGQRFAELLDQNDPTAETVMTRYEDRLARGLASVINILDPGAIVLGGGLSNLTRLYRTIPEIWSRYIFSDSINTKLLAPKHGDSSGVRGAARLWKKNETDRLD
ncbi:MAG: ROK family protein [Sedimenticola sp.]|nr:ROK family protein [Sedimenticola sp.]